MAPKLHTRCTWYRACSDEQVGMLPTARHAVAMIAIAVGAATTATAEPLRLDDATPRSIIVRFETSPRSRPDQLDRSWGPPLPARIEPAGTDLVRVVIDRQVVERSLFAEDAPEPGSFGDFVWLFDARTGHVLDARLEGRIVQQLDFGLMRSQTRAHVRARMSTRERAGFLPPRRILGNRVFRHCDPARARSDDCHSVAPVPLDRSRGYVNAVGVIEVATPLGIEARTFSPLGEALFLELGTPVVDEAPAVVDAPHDVWSPAAN
jgi:hypothetical protein